MGAGRRGARGGVRAWAKQGGGQANVAGQRRLLALNRQQNLPLKDLNVRHVQGDYEHKKSTLGLDGVRAGTRLAEVDNVESETEGHNKQSVDAQSEGGPLCDSGLVAEEAEVELWVS